MSNEKKDLYKKITEYLRKNKLFTYLIIVFLAVVLSLILFGSSDKDKTSNNLLDDNLSYVQDLEERLSKTLSCVENAGDVKVVINVNSGMESVLASKVTIDENGGIVEKKEEPIVVNGKTVVIKEKYPSIEGVLIVAEGADNISVKTKLLNATMSLLNVDGSKIEILTMK